MTMFVVQSALLILIAFILGCLFGALLKKWFGTSPVEMSTAPAEIAPIMVTPAVINKVAPVKKTVVKKAAPNKATTKKAPVKKVAARRIPAKKPAAAKDDLKNILGIGPQNEKKLNAAGITTFEQISKWTVKVQRETGEKLSFSGRIEREEWVKQAKALAKSSKTN